MSFVPIYSAVSRSFAALTAIAYFKPNLDQKIASMKRQFADFMPGPISLA